MGIHELEGGGRHPLLTSQSTQRTGTIWTAVAHIITGVMGSGVLSLAWSMSQLGWIAGPLAMLFFAILTLISSFLVCNCYRSPDPDHGPLRAPSLTHAVRLNLGERQARACGLLMHINYYGTGVAYIITTSLCISAIQRSNCYHARGHDAPCEFVGTISMLLFGIVQIFMSQIPDFHSMEWLSIIAAVMSFTYSSIGIGLGAAKVFGNGDVKGSIGVVLAMASTNKVWRVSQAVGDIAFAYPYSIIVLHIQDTLRSPPSENQTMKRASVIATSLTTFFYLSCGGFGYAAFGEQTPGNLLTGFGFYEPYWLIDFANACIILHLVGGYQVYAQPVFAAMDQWCVEQFPLGWSYTVKLPLLPAVSINFQRLWLRTAYVASAMVVAMVFPYFNEVLGVLGALSFWPLSVYFPVEMWLRQRSISPWTGKWVALRGFSAGSFAIAAFALVGSIQGLFAARFSSPCCEKENVKRGQRMPEEDQKLSSYIAQHGTRNWRLIPSMLVG